tara:strand:+ start:1745 stop:2056 length:312 start_codon:yes stop_codon:yes gene_type:complete
VIAGAEYSFETVGIDQFRESVEVFAKTRARFFGVDEPNFDAFANEFGEEGEKGVELLFGPLKVKVLQVGRGDPNELSGRGDEVLKNSLMDFFVENESIHEAVL